jgi:hypothetical protein
MKRLINYSTLKKNTPHLLITLSFVLVSLLFYYPIIQGKKLVQSDIVQYKGMSRQLDDFRESNNEETYWIDNAFGGMPTYQLGAKYPVDILLPLYKVIRLIPRPAHILFLYLFSIYVLLSIMKIPWFYSIFGSIGFGFSTYLLVILQVGHNTKALAISIIPLVFSGIILLFKKKYLIGFILTTLSLAMQIRSNHYQMTYYLIFLIGLFSIFFLVIELKNKDFKHVFISFLILIFSGLLSIGFNSTPLLATYEYSKFSTRSKSDLKLNFDGTKKIESSGLDYDYITEYSYGVFESLGLIIPRIQGGGSREDLGLNSKIYEFLIDRKVPPVQASQFSKNVPTYWGNQPILEAPAYIGITIFFFAVLGLFHNKDPIKYWLLSGIILSLFLSWGKNFSVLTDFFISYFPFYNKFRAVSSIQVLLEFCFPVLATLGLYTLFNSSKSFWKSVGKMTLIITGFLFLIFLLKGFFSFSGISDNYIKQTYGEGLFNEIIDARKYVFNFDIFRAIIFCLFIFLISTGYLFEKISKKNALIILIITLIFDLVGVSNRYIDRTQFVSKKVFDNSFQIQAADIAILKDSSRYRVFEPKFRLTGARTSYFHNSIGGYHGAKPRRFQELFNFYNENSIQQILDMLNVKYIIDDSENGSRPYLNPNSFGNAWFVKNLIIAQSADSVFNFLYKEDLENTAIIIKDSYNSEIPLKYLKDTLSNIKLEKATPNYLKYSSNSTTNQLAVFSEIFYQTGWELYVDGVQSEILNVNYVLRGAYLESGIHEIIFKFNPEIIKTGTVIRLFTLVIFISFLIGLFKYESNLKKGN